MENNIIDLITIIRNQGQFGNTKSFYLGKVISPFPNISVEFNNMVIDKEQLHLAKTFYDCQNKIFETSSVSTESGQHKHTFKFDKLKKGDIVILLNDVSTGVTVIVDKVVTFDGK